MRRQPFYTHSLHAFMKYCLGRSRGASQAQVDRSEMRGLQRLRQEPMWESDAPLFSSESVVPLFPSDSVASAFRRKFFTRWVPVAAATGLAVIVFARSWSSERLATAVAEGVFELVDGSRVEVRPQTDLSFERVDDGIQIRLGEGGIIVTATKQRNGHLYVQTKEVTVSVVGTVFVVNADTEGSRVAVIEGEVRVTQGATETKLRPGERVVTSSNVEALSVTSELAWSRRAADLLELMRRQSVDEHEAASNAPQASREPRVAFEVVSIRMRQGKGGGGAGVRGQGAGGGIDAVPGGPCESVGPASMGPGAFSPQLDPKRFAVTRAGLLWLITVAYGLGPRDVTRADTRCQAAVAQKLLSDGPDWVRTTEFDVEAGLPPGTPAYTIRQLELGEAPEIQKMLQTMLVERFNLVLKRERREMPVYTLSVAPGGPKLTSAKERAETIERDGGVNLANPTAMSSGTRRFPDCVPLRRLIEEGVDHEDANRCRRYSFGTGTVFAAVEGTRVSIDQLAARLQRVLERPVVNRTGIPGVFDIDLLFAPTLPWAAAPVARYVAEGRTILSSPSLFKALEDQIGLRLEASHALVETFIIERVEMPTPN